MYDHTTRIHAAIGLFVTDKNPFLTRFAVLAAVLIGLSACSAAPEGGGINDPFEPANRVSHAVNKGSDTLFFRPVSQVYGTVVPNPIRRSLSNAAANLDEPRSVVNHIAQGDLQDAGHTFIRFLVNSTIGVAGLFDVATGDFGLEERETGFGDTLAVWGVREGAYLELPLFGPSNERDAVGLIVDIAANPLSSIVSDSTDLETATSLPSALNSRFEFADSLDSILYDSEDSYSQLRLFFTENRRFQLGGQSSAENAFDPYEDLYEEVYEGLYDDF